MKKILLIIMLIFLFSALITSCYSGKYSHQNFFEFVDDDVQSYQLHKPADVKEDAKYPVLICLHAMGEADFTFSYRLTHKSLTNYVLIDRLINKINTNPDDYESYVVLPIEYESGGPAPKSVMMIVDKLIDEESADPNRIYITGVSMGSFAASDFIFDYPDIPACAVLICGCNYYPDKAHNVLNIPIRIYHSDDDDVVSVEAARTFCDELEKLGDAKIEYSELTGYRHACWSYAHNTDMIDWMYLQSKQGVK